MDNMNDYNFFSGYQRKKGIQINPGSPLFISVIIVLVCAGISAFLVVKNNALEKEIAEMSARAESIKVSQEYTQANNIQNSLDAMKQYDSGASIALENFYSCNLLNTELITGLFAGIPSSVRISSFSMDSLNVTMTCSLTSRKAASELLLGLKGTNLLYDVRLSSVSSNQDGTGSVAIISGVLKEGGAE